MFRGLLLYTDFAIFHINSALRNPDLLLSYCMITISLHYTIILIITHKSFNP